MKTINDFKNHIIEHYGLPEKTKIAIYKNPLKYKIEFIEDVNPTHIKIVYGKRWDLKSNCEKIAKIIIPSLITSELIVLSFYLSMYVFGLFTSFVVIGFYTSGTYKLFKLKINWLYGFFNDGVSICQRSLIQ
jgi:hypothetical protein